MELCLFKAMVFPVVMYECESWTIKRLSTKELMLSNCGAGEDSWESFRQQGDHTSQFWKKSTWIFIGRTDAKANTPVLLPPDVKSLLTGKDPDIGKDWGQEEKGTTEDETAGWHHWFSGDEFEKAPEGSERQGSLACCSPWGHKESDMT